MCDCRDTRSETVLSEVTRRSVFGAAGGGALVGVVTACSGGADGGAATDGGNDTGGGEPGGTEAPIATTGEVPVGGGTVLSEHEVVLTQPEEGAFRAFSTSCTHEGCPVDQVADGQIQCPCHGSRFSVEDGSPVEGPAGSPLEEIPIRVEGDDILLA
ncbi:iron-sulfur protein [Nocardiopsis terrae]|uniref:Cytochrome bc1 complex Rieske iron-sulfur subunit n=1 Tax=Nocardiopsis terrae TaxID=372655 RepID=A0ABR9HLL5_9ACTN|nr:Rieske (2Fe-2S) protein [Nocardiopsis terrae]MBE1459903.1 Rieske Fe-S protein [Nocardiopsis terrae]GHC93425.1 iron-sulfur protein [Nocardiopsis terrae]